MSDWQVQAREAGWLSPDEVKLKIWRARNMNDDSCRWCGAIRVHGHEGRAWWKRSDEPQPHQSHCQFFAGPVTHRPINGHIGTFDYWIYCACGRSYAQHDKDGNERKQCPDAGITFRQPRAEDLTETADEKMRREEALSSGR